MTLAGVSVESGAADALLARFRALTGLQRELKGSRIGMGERGLFFELFAEAGARATVGIAIRAVRPGPGEDRGDHDRDVYTALLEDVIGAMLPESGGCLGVIIDDGRYDPATLSSIRQDIGSLVAPLGVASLDLSHHQAGLQIADVVANTFFNRALPSERQGRLHALVEPLLESGRIKYRILDRSVLDASASPFASSEVERRPSVSTTLDTNGEKTA